MPADESIDDWPANLPDLTSLVSGLSVVEVTPVEDSYLVRTTCDRDSDLVLQDVYSAYQEVGYGVDCEYRDGYLVFAIEPHSEPQSNLPVTHIVLFLATVASTLYAGAGWYNVSPFGFEVIHAFPFALAVLGVLGIHELGHYVASQRYDVRATLPYFLPVPTLIGTMGAIIRMRGRIPTRRALFDIGVSGPLAGLAATIVVAIIGLHLPPVETSGVPTFTGDLVYVSLGFPPLLEFLAWATKQRLYYGDGMMVNPVVIGAWVGMFITFLNLLPVGQLDGGHIVRAMVGEHQETISSAVPLALFALSGFLLYVLYVPMSSVLLWMVWGVIAFFFMLNGSAKPVYDDPLDTRRMFVGVVTFVLGILCFTPVPIVVH